MKKTAIIAAFLLFSLTKLIGQINYFNNIFHINGLWTYGESIIYKDSCYYYTATTYDHVDTNLAIMRSSFCKSDYNGNLIYRKSIGWGERKYYTGYSGSLQQTHDNCFISVGDVEDTISGNAYLVKVNLNFDTIFYKEYSVANGLYFDIQQGKETYDKGFILIGTVGGTGAYNQDVFYLKTDSLGNEQWRKTINFGGIDFARNVLQTSDKGYLLGCYTHIATNYLSGDGRVVKLDSLGNCEWVTNIGGPNADGVPIIAIAKDSNFIVATSYSYKTYLSSPESSEYRIQVLKLDKTDGSLIWNKQYDTIRKSINSTMVKIVENGDVLIIGHYFSFEAMGSNGKAWFLKLNQNGDSLIYRQFYKANTNHVNINLANDFCITEDKSIVICGYFETDTAYAHLWLAKLDSFGCIQPGCQTVGIEEINHTKNEKVYVFPNPTTNQTTISYPQLINEGELQIYNILGQLVYEEKLAKASSQKEINTQNFKAGLYKVIVKEKGIIKGQVGLVKE